MEQKLAANKVKMLPLLRDAHQKILEELNKYCDDILQVLDKKLIPASSGSYEANVFYLKMKGDYYRYIAEYATNENRPIVVETAQQAYEAGLELIASNPLKNISVASLELACNASQFYFDL